MLAGPSAFAIDGSLEELVDGRIPRNGDIEIRFCKPAAAGAGPSNQPNKGQFRTDHLPLNLLDNFPTSKGYVSKANAIAEKSIRTSLVINHYEVPHVFPL